MSAPDTAPKDPSNGPWADQFMKQYQQAQHRCSEAHLAGLPALLRLVKVARGDTGQSGVVAHFLLGLYNGPEYPFHLTDLRSLDLSVHQDCLAVLAMDWSPAKEVHEAVLDGHRIFQELVNRFGARA